MIDRILSGRYKIVAAIGEGGMSRVWRAMDMNTGKMVAVKVLRDEFQEDETFVRRFEREAMAASRMTHPNIVNLLDVGLEDDGTRYLVIEYVSGKTLKRFIQESGALRPETAAQIIIRVLAAVQHAHQNGVVHRDIKPQNIMIDKEGTVKVSDFGIARLANSKTMSEDEETVMGSVYYFSPEQAKGAAVDEKSDLYSVGVVFYEMLAGQVPFTGDSPVSIAMKHIQELPEPPSAFNDAVPPAMDYVVLRAMEKRPRNRYATAAEMLQDVRLALEHPDTILAAKAEAERREREARAEQRRRQHAGRRTRWMRRILVGAFSLLLLVLMGLAGYVLMERILLSRETLVEVPSLIGMQRIDAVERLQRLELDPWVSEDWYDLVPNNIVAEQSIAPGTMVKPGEVVTLVVYRSRYDVRVPNVMGILLPDAQGSLSAAGLLAGDVEYVVSPAEYSMVIEQAVEAGSPAKIGDKVGLVVSGGSVTTPRLLGLTEEQAKQTLDTLKITAEDYKEVQVDDPLMVGKVIGQVPTPYTQIKRTDMVLVQVGIPDDTLFRASIVLDVSEVPVGTTVTITLSNTEDVEETWINLTVQEDQDSVMPINFFDKEGRQARFYVYYNGELQYDDTITFSR